MFNTWTVLSISYQRRMVFLSLGRLPVLYCSAGWWLVVGGSWGRSMIPNPLSHAKRWSNWISSVGDLQGFSRLAYSPTSPALRELVIRRFVFRPAQLHAPTSYNPRERTTALASFLVLWSPSFPALGTVMLWYSRSRLPSCFDRPRQSSTLLFNPFFLFYVP